MLFTVASEQTSGLQVVDWDIKESLNLSSVEVNGNQPVDLVHLQQVSDQLSSDWFPAPGLPILTGIAVVWHYHVDLRRTGPTEGINHDQ